jgi:hypothetical protein
LLPTARQLRTLKAVSTSGRTTPSPAPQVDDIPLPAKKPDPEPPRNNRLINPGTSPILD